MSEQPVKAMLSLEEAATYLGGPPITAATMQGLVRRRQIGYVKVGRAIVFPIAELDAYIESHTIKPIENPWGLTDGAMRNIRAGRAHRGGRSSSRGPAAG